MSKQIRDIEDIKLLVDSFYTKVREDDLLNEIFSNVIKDQWPKHMEKMYRFWETVLLGNHTYQGSPFAPHANLPIDKAHFTRWLNLFNQTIKENFTGEKAKEALWRAEKMAEMFQYKIEYYKNNSSAALL